MHDRGSGTEDIRSMSTSAEKPLLSLSFFSTFRIFLKEHIGFCNLFYNHIKVGSRSYQRRGLLTAFL